MIALEEFIQMGGYGQFIWPAYGLALTILFANLFQSRRQERNLVNSIYSAGQNHES